ncbi:MAG: DUF349 domain-containing protein, partial [Microbacterium sp.]
MAEENNDTNNTPILDANAEAPLTPEETPASAETPAAEEASVDGEAPAAEAPAADEPIAESTVEEPSAEIATVAEPVAE